MSDVSTPKKAVRRRKAGSTPIPTGPGNTNTCGHEGKCTPNACAVTYAGPVSRMHDHHMIIASRATSHIWPAAVITSLALLVTGTVAFSGVNAGVDSSTRALQKQAANRGDIERIVQQLNRIERAIADQNPSAQPTAREMMDKMNGLPKAEPRAETVKEKTSQE